MTRKKTRGAPAAPVSRDERKRHLLAAREEITRELQAIAKLEEDERRAARVALGARCLKQLDLLLALTPKHDRGNCSDDNPRNWCADGHVACKRCVLLEARQTNVWDEDLLVSLEITKEE